MKKYVLAFFLLFFIITGKGQQVTVDLSGSQKMIQLLNQMKSGSSQEIVSVSLDSILSTHPYQFMFQHYNRSWRPNTLPKDVFKRMILSLQWPGVYNSGENRVADHMSVLWADFYMHLPKYEAGLVQLMKAPLMSYIKQGVAYAQQWLPPNMKVPPFYLAIFPVGRSNAFAFNGSQGYDLLQLPIDSKGNIKIQELVATIAHESHHLGLSLPQVPTKNSMDSLLADYPGIFLPEGSATKFIDNLPGGHIPVVNKAKGYLFDEEVDSLWKAYTASEKKFFTAMVQQFEGIATGRIDRDSLNRILGTYWLNGATKPPLYFWGSELMGVIYTGLGKQAVFEVMNDPCKLFALYNKALVKKPSLKHWFAKVPSHLVLISQKIHIKEKGRKQRRKQRQFNSK